MKKLIFLSLVSSCSALMAVSPSYNFIEGGYTDYYDADGFLIRGNVAFDKNFFFAGALESVDDDGFESDKTLIGLGYRMPLQGNASAYGQISLVDFENSFGPFSTDDDGFQLGVGYRMQFKPETEFYGEVNHINIDSGARTEFIFGLRQKLQGRLGAYIEGRFDDFDNDGFSFGISYNF